MLDIQVVETEWVKNSTVRNQHDATFGNEILRNPVIPNRTEGFTSSTPWHLTNTYFPLYAQILIATFCVAMIIPAIFGNILALYTFCTIPRLRRYNNYYLVSLAVCDLVGGIVIMPVYGTYWTLGYWPFGNLACEVYKFINHIFTHATFLSVLVIAVDRYRALHYPIRHLQEQTAKHALKMISATYIIPLIIWSPLKLIQNFSDIIKFVFIENHCLPFYSNNIGFVITVSFFSFLPMVITTVIYIEVYRIASRARSRTYCSKIKPKEKINFKGRVYRRPSRSCPVHHVDETESSFTTLKSDLCSSQLPATRRAFKRSCSTVEFTQSTFINPTFENDIDDTKDDLVNSDKTVRTLKRYFSADNLFKRPPQLTSQDKQLSFTSIKKESSRATKTLTLTYFAMVLSGLPWTITSIVSQFCRPCIPYYFAQASVFIIHVSSTLDPLCYAAANPQFRDAFLQVLRYKRQKNGHGGKSSNEDTGTTS
ncbi:muscarinic acetylcholine receptor M4-like [Amphiura filiformis]|uniref:muscarinic acetylcholine receptor M4-like n=1 Tax=Amphiura filiformis TaxID=82378 RepID=UPI003B227C2B